MKPRVVVSWVYHKSKVERQVVLVNEEGTKLRSASSSSSSSLSSSGTSGCPIAVRTQKEPPEWVPNSASKKCMYNGCDRVFSALPFGPVRKHHCRACGLLVCASHSRHSVTLPQYGISTPVRVCDSCFCEAVHLRPDCISPSTG